MGCITSRNKKNFTNPSSPNTPPINTSETYGIKRIERYHQPMNIKPTDQNIPMTVYSPYVTPIVDDDDNIKRGYNNLESSINTRDCSPFRYRNNYMDSSSSRYVSTSTYVSYDPIYYTTYSTIYGLP